jgi:octaprenyl-diphosphate synthase
MESIIKKNKFSVREFKSLIELLEKYGGIAYSKERAKEHIEKGKRALLLFEPSKTRKTLEYIADYALIRKA